MNGLRMSVFIVAVAASVLFAVPLHGECCGSFEYDPDTEECCIGENYTVVAIGQCCNGRELDLGMDCCRDGVEFQAQYDPTTECCINPYARIRDKFDFPDYTECTNRVQRVGVGTGSDNRCTDSPNDPVSEVPTCGEEDSSFLPACLNHDDCFGSCHTGNPTAAFNACNNAFNSDLGDICDSLDSSTCRLACNALRGVYVGFVNSFGRPHFDTGQNNACQCCP